MKVSTPTRIDGVGTEADPRKPWHEYQRALLTRALACDDLVANGGASLNPLSNALRRARAWTKGKSLGLSHGDHGSSLWQGSEGVRPATKGL
jgi:hypothetical protein